jgi:hypothetical protein
VSSVIQADPSVIGVTGRSKCHRRYRISRKCRIKGRGVFKTDKLGTSFVVRAAETKGKENIERQKD